MKFILTLLLMLFAISLYAQTDPPTAAQDPIATQINQLLAPILLAVVSAAVMWAKTKLAALQNTQNQHAAAIHATALATPAPAPPSVATVAKPVVAALMICALCFSSCAQYQSAQNWLASPKGAATVDAIGAVSSTAAALDPSLLPYTTTAGLALRTFEGLGAAPTAAQVTASISTITGSPTVASALGAKSVTAINTAVGAGIPLAAAIEAVATSSDIGAAKTAPAAKSAQVRRITQKLFAAR